MKRNKSIVATVTAVMVRSSVQVTRAQSKSIAARVREEDIPISMFVSAMRAISATGRSSRFALNALRTLAVLSVVGGLSSVDAPAAHAQQKTTTVRTVTPTVPTTPAASTTSAKISSTTGQTNTGSMPTPQTVKRAAVPTRIFTPTAPAPGHSYGMAPLHQRGEGLHMRFLPQGVTQRSLTAPKYTPTKKGRVQIGTVAPVQVPEKVVNLTVPYTVPDMRNPFWSPDQTKIYYSSNQDPAGTDATVANGRPYHLYYIPSSIPANVASAALPTALNAATDTQDYEFPAINANGSLITFIRSSDGKAINDTTKTWVLCYAPVPTTGATIDPAATVVAGGVNITFPNAKGQTVAFATVQRPSWLGNNNIVFSALLTGDTAYHIFQANLQPTGGQSIIFQLTAGPADERNPAVAPDGKNVAFDSNATPIIGTTGTEGYGTAGLPRQVAFPNNVPTTSNGVGTVRTNGAINRNIFTLNEVAVTDPSQVATGGVLPAYTVRQFTERGADAVNADNEEPAWSSLNTNQYSDPNQENEFLAFSSTRVSTFDPTDPTGTTATGYTIGKLHHIYYALATQNVGNTITSEGAIGTTSGATYLDTGDSTTAPLFDDRYPTWSPFISAFRIGFQSDRIGAYLTDNFQGYNTSFKLSSNRDGIFVATVIDTTAPSLLRFDLNNTTGEVVHVNLVKNQNEPFDPSTSVRNSDDGVVPGSTIHLAVRVEDRESGMRPDKAVYLQIKNPNSKYQSQFQGSTNPREHKEFIGGPLGTPFITINGLPAPYVRFDQNGIVIANYGYEYEAEAIGITNNITTDGNVLVNTGTISLNSSTSQPFYFGHNEALGQLAGSSLPANSNMLYEAGVDDRRAFAGTSLVPLDGSGTLPPVWLELKPLYQFDPNTGSPVLDSTGNQKPYLPTDLGTNQPAGGVLYGAALKLPDEPSDWYIDVILYDNAVNPFDTTEKYNTIIYDNVWGFSSAPPITPRQSDILVVSDYALGQKFFNSRFTQLQQGGASNNLLPIDFGSESYFTDVDVKKLFNNLDYFPSKTPIVYGGNRIENVLGVDTYQDGLVDATSTRVDGYDLTDFSRYNIWRILSRGPLPTNVLNAYLPTISTRTPDVFPNPTTKIPYETTPQTVVNAQRMVVWNSPFAGDLFTGQGTIVDTTTQNNLSAFVNAGGRLFLSGQDVAFALTSNGGSTNSFLTNTMQVTYQTDNSTVGQITPVANAAGSIQNRIENDPWTTNVHNFFDPDTGAYNPPGSGPIFLTANTAQIDRDAALTVGYDFGSSDVVGVTPLTAGTTPSAGAIFNHGGAQGLTVAKTGQGVAVFASFGFETVSQDWYSYTVPGELVITTRDRRTELMHNIACALRSGSITGQIRDTSGNAVANVLVRAVYGGENNEASGTAISDSSGNYVITGLQPDGYNVYAYKNGFYSQHAIGGVMHGTGTVQVNVSLKPANPGSLSGFAVTAAPAGNKGGVFQSDGKTPIQGIAVQVRQQDLTNGAYDIVAAKTTSGVDGSYSLPSIPIGNYVIIANPKDQNPNYNANVATVQVTATPNAGFALSAGETVNADGTITIAENTSFFVNFFLTASPEKVTGLVESSATGNPGIVGAIVSATVSGSTTIVATATTDANGAYTLTLVNPALGSDATLLPSGTYILTASKPGFATGTVTVIVAGSTTATALTVPPIILQVLPAGNVEGLVQVSSGSQVSAASAAGAVVSLYPIITVNGVQQPDMSQPPLTGTVSASPTTTPVTGYDNATGVTGSSNTTFNFVIANVPGGAVGTGTQYIAILTPSATTGLTPSPAQALVTVFSSTTTYDVQFLLQPPHTYAAGLDLIALPGDFSNVADSAGVFGLTPLGDNNGNGVAGEAADLAIYNAFNVAEWTGTSYVINPQIKFQAGKGYFVRFGASEGVVQKATPVTASSFTISLTNNWNLIGNPFNDQTNPTVAAGNIDLTNSALVTFSYTTANGAVRTNVPEATAVADGAVQRFAYFYTGSANGSQYVATALLQGYNGYWFRAYVPVEMTLTYPGSSLTTKAAHLPVAINGKYTTITRAQADAMPGMRSLTSTGINSWQQRISVTQGTLADNDNTIGVQADAKSGWDNRYDNEKPPVVDSSVPSVRLTIDGTDAKGRAVALSDRTMPASVGTKVWNMTVTPATATSDAVTISWPNTDRLPRGITPVLVDVTTGKRMMMRDGVSSYTFRPSGRAQAFRVEVAPPVSLPLDIMNVKTSHTGTTRAQGSSAFRFSFAITRDANVQAQVLSLSGRVIRSISTRAAAGAESSLLWDGRNALGAAAPIGPYVVDIKAVDDNGQQVERKVMFMNME